MIHPEKNIPEGLLMLVPWVAPVFMKIIGATELTTFSGIIATASDILLLAIFSELRPH